MQKYIGKLIYVNFLYSCLGLLVGCASIGPNIKPVAPLREGVSYRLKLKANIGRKEVINYHSHSYIKSFIDNQLNRERYEIADFKVQTDTIKFDQTNNFIHVISKTIAKDGIVNLHDMAFPDLGERLEYVYKPNGTVVYAGEFPKTSIFFVPPLPLPPEEVKKGDTWEMNHSWVSMDNKIPLHINMVTILKDYFPCNGGVCADLEISGEIGIIASLTKDTNIKSHIRGRVLFSIDKGSVLWSIVRNEEELKIQETMVKVVSCMKAVLIQPKIEVWPYENEFTCDPAAQMENQIKGTISKLIP